MRGLADQYPGYNFEANKGYPCPVHKSAPQAWAFGHPSPILGLHGLPHVEWVGALSPARATDGASLRGLSRVGTAQLTESDQAMLHGDAGEAARVAMELPIAVGDSEDAPALLDISASHIDGGLYHGQAGLDFAFRWWQPVWWYPPRSTCPRSICCIPSCTAVMSRWPRRPAA